MKNVLQWAPLWQRGDHTFSPTSLSLATAQTVPQEPVHRPRCLELTVRLGERQQTRERDRGRLRAWDGWADTGYYGIPHDANTPIPESRSQLHNKSRWAKPTNLVFPSQSQHAHARTSRKVIKRTTWWCFGVFILDYFLACWNWVIHGLISAKSLMSWCLCLVMLFGNACCTRTSLNRGYL